jgi:hypothetical protein
MDWRFSGPIPEKIIVPAESRLISDKDYQPRVDPVSSMSYV